MWLHLPISRSAIAGQTLSSVMSLCVHCLEMKLLQSTSLGKGEALGSIGNCAGAIGFIPLKIDRNRKQRLDTPRYITKRKM